MTEKRRSPWYKNIHLWPQAKLQAQGPRKVTLPAEGSPATTNGHHPPLVAPEPLEAPGGPPESILCFPSEILDDDGGSWQGNFSPGRFSGLRTDAFESASRLFPQGISPHHFRPRTRLLEADLSWKQVVACVVPWHAPSRQVWTFVRGQSEGRLGGKVSCLPGGHVDSLDAWPGTDKDPANPDLLEATFRAAIREMKEEIVDWPDHWRNGQNFDLILTGVVNDESTHVDRCHFGIVYRLCVPSPEAFAKTFDKLSGLDSGWQSIDDLANGTDRVESWTRHVAVHLAERTPARSSH